MTATATLSGIWPDNRRPFVAGSGLVDKYRFSHLHFHWSGDGDGDCGEHIVNGLGQVTYLICIFVQRLIVLILYAAYVHTYRLCSGFIINNSRCTFVLCPQTPVGNALDTFQRVVSDYIRGRIATKWNFNVGIFIRCE